MLAKHNESNEYVDDTGAQRENHCQTHGKHLFTLNMLPTLSNTNNKFISARWARCENHSQTHEIHMFAKNMLAKPMEK